VIIDVAVALVQLTRIVLTKMWNVDPDMGLRNWAWALIKDGGGDQIGVKGLAGICGSVSWMMRRI
jgi:hypothetical protein